jgi:CubicO group peptidase (beta-lactamase class C family)
MMAQIDRRMVLGGLLAASLPRCGRAHATQPPETGPLSGRAVAALLTQHKVPGASLAIINDGALVARWCYGFAKAERAVAADTCFCAGSISKTINALAILKLVSASRLDLDAPVNDHLVSWKLPDNVFTERRAVTVRMLLSHTGGTTVTVFDGYAPGRPLPTLRQILDGAPPANNDPVRVAWPPEMAFRYSGGGITVLQQLVVDLAGEPYPTAIARLVLDPLGMVHSDYLQESERRAHAPIALGHDAQGAVLPGGFRIHPELAAAGLWTTPSDIARAVLAIIRSSQGKADAFLPQPLARSMLTPVAQDAGLGVFLDGTGLFTHVGTTAGYHALFIADAQAGRASIVMNNGDDGDAVCVELNHRVAQQFGWHHA